MPRAGRREESEAVKQYTIDVVDIMLALFRRARDWSIFEEHIKIMYQELSYRNRNRHIKTLRSVLAASILGNEQLSASSV